MNLDKKMQTAIERWLWAHERFYRGAAEQAMLPYYEADRQLLAAFVVHWHLDDPGLLACAYHAFRRALVASSLGKHPSGG